jgi:uroporphyrinogen decarboxylase
LSQFEAYPWPDPDEADYSEFEEVGGLLPAGMQAILYSGPIFQWIWMLMGFETFAFALRDDIQLVERMFLRVGQTRLRVLENVLDQCSDIGAVWILDDIAYSEGLMVSHGVLRRFLFPWFRRMREICSAKALPLIYHTDGAFWQVLDDILDIGFDAIHPIEPKGMGADMRALKEQVGARLCLVGGVDLDILIRGTPEEVALETRQKIQEAGRGGGYIVGSSNTIPDSVPLGNYRSMVDTALAYGAY